MSSVSCSFRNKRHRVRIDIGRDRLCKRIKRPRDERCRRCLRELSFLARPTCHAFRIYNDSWLSDLSLNNFLPRSAKGHVASMNPKRGATNPMYKIAKPRNYPLIQRIHLQWSFFFFLLLQWSRTKVSFKFWIRLNTEMKSHWTRTWRIYVYSKRFSFVFFFWKKYLSVWIFYKKKKEEI